MQMLLLLLVALLLSSPTLLAAEQLPFCSNANTITHMAEGTYKSSLLNLAKDLIASVNKTGTNLATGTAETGPDVVYGAVLCQGRSTGSGESCASRLRRVLDTASTNGTNSSDASYSYSQKSVTLYDHEFQALLSFSDRDFLSSFSNAPECTVSAYLNPPPDADHAQFSKQYKYL